MKYKTIPEMWRPIRSNSYLDMYEQDEPIYRIAAWKELYIGYKYYEV